VICLRRVFWHDAEIMKWEYLEVRGIADKEGIVPVELSKLGSEGWELVTIVPFTQGGFTRYYDYFFKRPNQ
jgi:hypothetical protein